MEGALNYFQEVIGALDAWEVVGTVFGFACVFLSIRAHVLLWPTCILSSLAYGILFFKVKLYADALLQLFFIVTCVIGWWYWVRGGKNKSEPPISSLSPIGRLQIAGLSVFAIVAVGWLFRSYTDAHIPFWDATTSGLSVTAQLLLTRKKIENWILWGVVDSLSVGIYLYKELYLTAVLYAVFLWLAWKGLREWKRMIYQQKTSKRRDE